MVSEQFNNHATTNKSIERELNSAFPLSPDSSSNCFANHPLHKCRSDSVLTDFTFVSIPTPTQPYSEETKTDHDGDDKSSSAISKLLESVSQFLFSCLSLLIPVFIVISLFILGKSYVKRCVIWLDGQEPWIVFLVFTLLYVACAFPIFWGYIVLNIGCGYHFGFVRGLIVTAFAVSIGLAIAHVSMKACCSRPIRSHLSKMNIIKSLIEVMKSSQAFKVVIVSRLSPIPFGLQNAAFAVSCIGLPSYLIASILGLLPTQLINIYLGTTLRSMEEFLTDESTAVTGYAVLAFQILGSVTLMACIVRRAKKELSRRVAKKPDSFANDDDNATVDVDNNKERRNSINLGKISKSVKGSKGPLVKSSSQVIFSPKRNLFKVAIAS